MRWLLKSTAGLALNIFLLASSVALCVAIIEFAIRYTENPEQKKGGIYSRNLEYDMWEHRNADGFRGPHISSIPEGSRKIFLIGDSFFYGIGVDNEFSIPSLLQEYFETGDGCTQMVLNFGAPGAGPTQYAKIAEKYAKYTPDVVFLGLYVDNDIQQSTVSADLPELTQPGITFLDRNEKLYTQQGWWQKLRIVMLSKKLFSFLEAGVSGVQPECKAIVDTAVDVPSYNLPIELERLVCDEQINPHLLPRGAVGDNTAYYEVLAERFEKDPLTRESILAVRDTFPDATFAIALLPSKYQVNTQYFEHMRKMGFTFNQNIPVDTTLQATIERWATEQGILYINPLADLQRKEYESGAQNYYLFDDHLTEAGNRSVAYQLYRWMQRKGVVGCDG